MARLCASAGYRHEVDEICALLEYYAACSGNSLPTFRNNLSVTYSRVKKSNKLSVPYSRVRVSRNVGKELPLYLLIYLLTYSMVQSPS